MEGRFPYEKLIKYPHLRSEEIAIWERFIDLNPDYFSSVDYDIHVGKPREYALAKEDVYKKGLQELSRKRIDFVGYKDKEVWIGEVKPNALLEAFGQLIGEKDLYLAENPTLKKAKMILITDRENPDMRELSAKYKIEYFVV